MKNGKCMQQENGLRAIDWDCLFLVDRRLLLLQRCVRCIVVLSLVWLESGLANCSRLGTIETM
jgi:hypothetical protein